MVRIPLPGQWFVKVFLGKKKPITRHKIPSVINYRNFHLQIALGATILIHINRLSQRKIGLQMAIYCNLPDWFPECMS